MQENRDLILMGDFNCGEVDWENLDSMGGPESWGSKLLELTMENMMLQWVMEKKLGIEELTSHRDLIWCSLERQT